MRRYIGLRLRRCLTLSAPVPGDGAEGRAGGGRPRAACDVALLRVPRLHRREERGTRAPPPLFCVLSRFLERLPLLASPCGGSLWGWGRGRGGVSLPRRLPPTLNTRVMMPHENAAHVVLLPASFTSHRPLTYSTHGLAPRTHTHFHFLTHSRCHPASGRGLFQWRSGRLNVARAARGLFHRTSLASQTNADFAWTGRRKRSGAGAICVRWDRGGGGGATETRLLSLLHSSHSSHSLSLLSLLSLLSRHPPPHPTPHPSPRPTPHAGSDKLRACVPPVVHQAVVRVQGRGFHSLTSELNLRTFGTHRSRSGST